MAKGVGHADHRARSRFSCDGVDGGRYSGDGSLERVVERFAELAAAVRDYPAPHVLQQVIVY